MNFDERFEQLKTKPTIVNDLSTDSKDDERRLNRLIYTAFTGDMLSNIPSCECGETTGMYNTGFVCTSCRTPVRAVLDEELHPLTWIRSPDGVEPLMNPNVWKMLKMRFSVNTSFNVIQWLTDTRYQHDNVPAIVSVISQFMIDGQQIQRGYNFFVKNFDSIMEQLFQMRAFALEKGEVDTLKQLLHVARDCVFSTHIPVPHRSLLVLEENNMGSFVDSITTGAVDAIHAFAGIDTGSKVYDVITKQNRAVRVLDQLGEFYWSTYKDTLAGKKGVLRKHTYASRAFWSFRNVVTSITNAHNYDEIYIPWGVATSVLRIHIENKLLAMDYTPAEAISFINEHAQKYHPLLDAIFVELIAESGNGRGISCFLNRNPSLQRGSIQHVYITKVKTNPRIQTVSMSILVVRSLNADFDGRQHRRLKSSLIAGNSLVDNQQRSFVMCC